MSLLSIFGALSRAIFAGTSLLYTTLGEVIHQRSGIVDLGLEGLLLVSASTGFAVTSVSGNPYLGALAAMLTGGLFNMVFGYLVINRQANQLASGLAMMFLGFGLSALIGNAYVGSKTSRVRTLRFQPWQHLRTHLYFSWPVFVIAIRPAPRMKGSPSPANEPPRADNRACW